MLRGQKYKPYGFVQSHPNIKYVTSISDLHLKDRSISSWVTTRAFRLSGDACAPAALSEEDEVATVATASAASGAEDELEPVVTPEAMEHLREEKEDELRERWARSIWEFRYLCLCERAGARGGQHGERLYDGSSCPDVRQLAHGPKRHVQGVP